MKVRWDGELAAKVFVYIDDGKLTGPTMFLTWQARQAHGAVCTSRGVQDALQKHTSLCGMASQDKWDKTKQLIEEMGEMVAQDHLLLAQLLQV
jgi:hypothetical protein